MAYFNNNHKLLLLLSALCVLSSSPARAQDRPELVQRMIQSFDSQCELLNKEETVQKILDRVPPDKREVTAALISIRRSAECECFSGHLRAMDAEQYRGMDAEQFANAMQPVFNGCGVEATRKHFQPLCKAILIPETGDQKKIDSACQCMDKNVQTMDKDELIKGALVDQARYQKKAKGEAMGAEDDSEFHRRFRDCREQAGIESDTGESPRASPTGQ